MKAPEISCRRLGTSPNLEVHLRSSYGIFIRFYENLGDKMVYSDWLITLISEFSFGKRA